MERVTPTLGAKDGGQLLRLRQKLGKLNLRILNELGYVPAEKAGAGLLFDVIAPNEDNGLLVATNVPLETWPFVSNGDSTGAAFN